MFIYREMNFFCHPRQEAFKPFCSCETEMVENDAVKQATLSVNGTYRNIIFFFIITFNETGGGVMKAIGSFLFTVCMTTFLIPHISLGQIRENSSMLPLNFQSFSVPLPSNSMEWDEKKPVLRAKLRRLL